MQGRPSGSSMVETNDGELANRLTHPSYEVPKTYVVQTRGPLAKGVSNRLREGVELEDGVAQLLEAQLEAAAAVTALSLIHI